MLICVVAAFDDCFVWYICYSCCFIAGWMVWLRVAWFGLVYDVSGFGLCIYGLCFDWFIDLGWFWQVG